MEENRPIVAYHPLHAPDHIIQEVEDMYHKFLTAILPLIKGSKLDIFFNGLSKLYAEMIINSVPPEFIKDAADKNILAIIYHIENISGKKILEDHEVN